MQVAFYFAGEITQALDAIPWVRCASGNVSILLRIPGMFAVDGNLDFPLFLCKQFEEFNYQSFADFMQSKWAAV